MATVPVRGMLTPASSGSTAGANTLSPVLPSGIVDGDTAYLLVAFTGIAAEPPATPAGWTELVDQTVSYNNNFHHLYSKTVHSADSGATVTVAFPSGTIAYAHGIVVGGTHDNVSTPWTGGPDVASLTVPGVAPVAADCMVLAFESTTLNSGVASDITQPGGFTERANVATTHPSLRNMGVGIASLQLSGQAGVAQGPWTATIADARTAVVTTVTVAPATGTPTATIVRGSIQPATSGTATGTMALSAQLPTGIHTGDLAVLAVSYNTPTAEPVVVPSGWTERGFGSSRSNCYLRVFTKPVSPADSGGMVPVSFALGAISTVEGVVLGNAAFDTVQIYSGTSGWDTPTITLPAIVPGLDDCVVVACETVSLNLGDPAAIDQPSDFDAAVLASTACPTLKNLSTVVATDQLSGGQNVSQGPWTGTVKNARSQVNMTLTFAAVTGGTGGGGATGGGGTGGGGGGTGGGGGGTSAPTIVGHLILPSGTVVDLDNPVLS